MTNLSIYKELLRAIEEAKRRKASVVMPARRTSEQEIKWVTGTLSAADIRFIVGVDKEDKLNIILNEYTGDLIKLSSEDIKSFVDSSTTFDSSNINIQLAKPM